MNYHAMDRLEQLRLYGLIEDEYARRDDGKYTFTLTSNGSQKTMTAAEVKMFTSGFMAAIQGFVGDTIKVTATRQVLPASYSYGWTLTELLVAAEARYEVPLER